MNTHIQWAIISFLACSLIAGYGAFRVCLSFAYQMKPQFNSYPSVAHVMMMVVFGLAAIVLPLASVILSPRKSE